MARGWESKSVESQIEMAEERRATAEVEKVSAEARGVLRKRESILSTRARVVREMEAAANPKYKAMCLKAIADLDRQLADVPSGT
jgi:predicted  nucleic acid-binding Zn-ribbon protein